MFGNRIYRICFECPTFKTRCLKWSLSRRCVCKVGFCVCTCEQLTLHGVRNSAGCTRGHQRVFGAWVTGPASAIRPSGPHIHHWPMAWCSPAFVKTPRGNGVSGPDKNKISLMTKFLLGSQRGKNSAICFHYFPWLWRRGRRVCDCLCTCMFGVRATLRLPASRQDALRLQLCGGLIRRMLS